MQIEARSVIYDAEAQPETERVAFFDSLLSPGERHLAERFHGGCVEASSSSSHSAGTVD